jgi:flagellar motor switch protein FliM
MAGVLIGIFAVAALALLVWVERSSAAAQQAEDAKLAQEIAHLPVEVQARLWAAKLRFDAERDLY